MSSINQVEELGALIKAERKEQGLTQEDLAGISGTGRRFISELEAGKETVQLNKVLLVLRALGLTLALVNKWPKSRIIT